MERACKVAVDDTISRLHRSALEQLEAVNTLEQLEAVRIEALGRKGKLSEISKELGKLPPEERARIGKLLNAVKQELEARIDARKATLESESLDARLQAEWIDLTAPAPGVRPGSVHPVTQ